MRIPVVFLTLAVGFLTAASISTEGCSKKNDLVAPVIEQSVPAAPIDSTASPVLPVVPIVRPMRLAADPRQAIIEELFYALNQAHTGFSNKAINGNAVSDWNYICSDQNAYSVMRSRYGSNSSVWGSFFTGLDRVNGGYLVPTTYGLSGGYGRGGQCVYFVNLILYRSATYWDNNRFLSGYGDYIYDYNHGRQSTKPLDQVQPGDVIQTTWNNGHRAIAVLVFRDASGRVTAIDVIDSNFCNGDGAEIIGRHLMKRIDTGKPGNGGVSDLDSYFALKLNYR